VPNGWLRVGVALCLLSGCKAARQYAEKQYDERRAEEVKAENVAAREEAERPPTPRPSGPGLAPGKYKLKALSVAAFTTTARNKAWDDAPGAEPDMHVLVNVDGKQITRCKPTDDRFAGLCTFDDVEFEITATSTIMFDVLDRDSLLDDPIGKATLDDPSAWGVGMEMQLVPTRRLKSASITLARVPTWWDLHGTNVLVFAGLLVVGIAGGIALSNRREKRKVSSAGRICGACGARLANYAKCSDCGADQT
jgi:hypothetical protein